MTSRLALELVIDRRFIDPSQKEDLMQRLSGLLGIPRRNRRRI